MDRRFGMRGQVDLPLIQHVDGFAHECRVVDISSRGLVVQRSKSLAARDARMICSIEIPLGKTGRKVQAMARTIWTRGSLHAMRYIGVSEADQLEIAELLDHVHKRGAVLH